MIELFVQLLLPIEMFSSQIKRKIRKIPCISPFDEPRSKNLNFDASQTLFELLTTRKRPMRDKLK